MPEKTDRNIVKVKERERGDGGGGEGEVRKGTQKKQQ